MRPVVRARRTLRTQTKTMRINKVEINFLETMLADRACGFTVQAIDWDRVEIAAERVASEIGCISTLEESARIRAFSNAASGVWNRGGGYVTSRRMNCGFIVYLQDGCIEAVEGFTFGEPWPVNADVVEAYLLVEFPYPSGAIQRRPSRHRELSRTDSSAMSGKHAPRGPSPKAKTARGYRAFGAGEGIRTRRERTEIIMIDHVLQSFSPVRSLRRPARPR